MSKGTLSNGTTEIKGTYNYEETGSISFVPEGSQSASFFPTREWKFTADKKPLPREFVIMSEGWLPMIRLGREVYQVTYQGEMVPASDLGYDPIERLGDKGAQIFKVNGNELNKEEYV